jgi:hypothetical protein
LDITMSETERGLLLSEDCMGKLLPLLGLEDIQALLCVSKDWRHAGLRQLRVLSPLHLPSTPPACSFNSLETLQLPLVRHVGSAFTYIAPLREFDSISRFSHAAHLDLSGQQVPSYCCMLLSQHFPRLTALDLSTCSIEYEDLQHLSRLTGLQSLNLGGLESRHQYSHSSVAGAGPSSVGTTATMSDPAAAAKRERAMRLAALAAILSLPQLQHLNLDVHQSRQVRGLTVERHVDMYLPVQAPVLPVEPLSAGWCFSKQLCFF